MRVPPAHHGLYEVVGLSRDGVEASPDDPGRWRRVVVNELGGLAAFTVDNHRLRFALEQDAEKKTFTLTPHGGQEKAVFRYAEPTPDTLTLDGELGGHALSLRLRRVPVEGTFLLTSRGFHWVNEFPFNR